VKQVVTGARPGPGTAGRVTALPFAPQLLRLVLVVVVPLFVFATLVAGWNAFGRRADLRAAMAETARAAQLALDGELRVAGAALQALAATHDLDTALRPGPPAAETLAARAAFRDRTIEVLRRHPGRLASVTLLLGDGQAVASNLRPLGAPLPNLEEAAGLFADSARARWAEVAAGDGVGLLGVVQGPLLGLDVLMLALPVRRGDRLAGMLVGSLPLAAVAAPLRGLLPAPGWALAVVDMRGLVVAHEPAAPALLRRPTPEAVQAFRQGGAEAARIAASGPDGTALEVALRRVAAVPWVVMVSVPRALVDAPLWRAAALAAAGGTLAMTIAALGALLIGRRMRDDLLVLAEAAATAATPQEAARPLAPPRIAEVAAARAALAESEARFRVMADNIPQLAWMARPDGGIFWYNRRWYDYTGTTLEQMRGRGWKAVHHPDHVADVAARLQRSFASGEPWEDTFPMRRHDGAWRWFLSRAEPIRDAEGLITLWFGTNTDVTAEREAQAALRASEAQVRLAGEAAGVGFFSCDLLTGETYWSATMYALYGLDPSLPAPHMDEGGNHLDLVHPDDRAMLRDARRSLAADRRRVAFMHDFRIRRADTGALRWIAARGELERDAAGRAVLVRGAQQDITERKEAEDRQGLMLAELNHRVKNTLATVQSIAAQTLRGVDPAARRALEGRLLALAAAHDVLTREAWSGAALDEVVGGALAPHGGVAGGRFRLEGPLLRLAPRAALALAMGLHELATNALKYGALSTPSGHVALRWDVSEGPDPVFRLTWTEHGGPPVQPAPRRGFGARLLERSLAQDLGGTARLDFAPGGLSCTLEAPLAAIAPLPGRAPLPHVGRAAP
jgi:PAS domain S-box-containing protein